MDELPPQILKLIKHLLYNADPPKPIRLEWKRSDLFDFIRLVPPDVTSSLEGSFASIPGTEHSLTGLLDFWGTINCDRRSQVCLKIVDIPKLLHFYSQHVAASKRGDFGKTPTLSSREAAKTNSNITWEDLTIRFRNDHDVDITRKTTIERSDYRAMGFQDKRTRKPNKQWMLLLLLAAKGGRISWNEYSSGRSSTKERIDQDFGTELEEESGEKQNKGYSLKKLPDKTKKTKELLSKGLKNFFQIDKEPFLSYKATKAYKIRINLIPEYHTPSRG